MLLSAILYAMCGVLGGAIVNAEIRNDPIELECARMGIGSHYLIGLNFFSIFFCVLLGYYGLIIACLQSIVMRGVISLDFNFSDLRRMNHD